MYSSGRFACVYRIKGNKNEAIEKARDLCIEQTVEFPPELIKDAQIRDVIIGKVESCVKSGEGFYSATISYADETAGEEITQLLNVAFGNTSLKPGIRLERIILSHGLGRLYPGPRFGIAGIRKLTRIPNRPLIASALKPMGLDSLSLSELAYAFAKSGINIIKDDHGLANQGFSQFRERALLCARAVARANKETGGNALYAPNVTADGNEVIARALFAKKAGAQALVISPGLAGFHAIKLLREDNRIALPILFHPAFLGSYALAKDGGISHYALFGQIPRLSGADAAIFPNFGGRFSFSSRECEDVVRGAKDEMGKMARMFPMPAGGIALAGIKKLVKFYGDDTIFLVGGGLFSHDPDLAKSIGHFKSLIQGKD
jgi:ribulose-bisphosphate carboxylase large chain